MAEATKPRGRPKGSKDKQPRDLTACKQNLEKARAASPIMQGQTAEMPAGYNAKMVNFIMAIMPTYPLDYNDVAEMERRFTRYLQLCAEWDMKVGNQAAYLAIGIDKAIAWEWVNIRTTNPARTDFIKKVQKICGLYRESLMQDGKINPVTGIFWQKNYDGLKDQNEVILTPNNPLGDMQNAEALRQKYLESAGIAEELPEGAERDGEK